MFYVYVLYSHKDGRLYTGYTGNLDQRLQQHRDGRNTSTKNRLPLDLIYYEAYINKLDALGREKFLKSGSGKKYLKRQLTHFFSTEAAPTRKEATPFAGQA